MVRVKNILVIRRRCKKILKLVKGYFGFKLILYCIVYE